MGVRVRMSVEVETRDCAALSEAEIEDMAAMGGAFDLARLNAAKEEWVLAVKSNTVQE